ncbi:hypothetical protein PAAG_05706 [Paracoccidioides lutzii Pb01]|uniref:Uncharacterized protein n=1 Tax=Paracoccidioides lutzii (strain ATCC MYA-826 / Pb01) TaxID=502779 RepID=C1H4L3_PARBA|nr:hypothetical protein PAAG_05706 [Paracoccidioides lutzii Pb01]EEH34657.2 hypothetical protein PAAG_05706 [Paracoccidioides lutzii Pb01]
MLNALRQEKQPLKMAINHPSNSAGLTGLPHCVSAPTKPQEPIRSFINKSWKQLLLIGWCRMASQPMAIVLKW